MSTHNSGEAVSNFCALSSCNVLGCTCAVNCLATGSSSTKLYLIQFGSMYAASPTASYTLRLKNGYGLEYSSLTDRLATYKHLKQ